MQLEGSLQEQQPEQLRGWLVEQLREPQELQELERLGELLARNQQPEPATGDPDTSSSSFLRESRVDGAPPRVLSDHRIQSTTRVFNWGHSWEGFCSKKFPEKTAEQPRIESSDEVLTHQ